MVLITYNFLTSFLSSSIGFCFKENCTKEKRTTRQKGNDFKTDQVIKD